jgi:ElaA protein
MVSMLYSPKIPVRWNPNPINYWCPEKGFTPQQKTGNDMSNTPVWRFRHFDLFSASEWHAMIKLRGSIFVVEQRCPYLDPDDKDPSCWHLEGLLGGQLIACLRIAPPGAVYPEASIGRVAVAPDNRGQSLGRELMVRSMAYAQDLWPNDGLRISGQAYLQEFYHTLGFATVKGPYLEDDLPHYEMLLR